MKNFFLFFLLLPSVLFAQAEFTVTGTITGLSDGAEVRINNVNDNGLVTKTTAKGGTFTLKGALPEPGLYWITIGGEQAQHIFLENSAIKITGAKKDLKNMKVDGSSAHKDFEQFRNLFNPLVGELNATAAAAGKAKNDAEAKTLMARYDSLNKLVNTEVGRFVSTKPSSFVSPFLLFITAELIDDPILMEQRFNSLSENVRNSGIGKSMVEFIAFQKVGAVGTDAIDFTQNDPDGKPVSLSSFKGKYVLVDFWASWCKPCRLENPNVVKAYNTFNNKNFTVFGVSLDQKKEAWLEAIKKDGLAWTQVSDLKFWENEAAQLYHVQGIPHNILVGPDGKIVAKNLRGEALEAKLCELLGCN